MPGASPLADSLDTVKRLEDAGAAAIVLRSLFEEQITREQNGLVHDMEVTTAIVRRGALLLPEARRVRLRPRRVPRADPQDQGGGEGAGDRLAQRHDATRAGSSYAQPMQQAGADALELNVYYVATDPKETGARGRAAARSRSSRR